MSHPKCTLTAGVTLGLALACDLRAIDDVDASDAEPPPGPVGYFDGVSRLDGLPEIGCGITVTNSHVSPNVATVGIVSFSTSLPLR